MKPIYLMPIMIELDCLKVSDEIEKASIWKKLRQNHFIW